jgi:radical SAM-linked protein
MASDTRPAPAPPSPPGAPRPFHKVRLRFHKGGPLRFLSHHDLLRTFERMLRRAALPVRRTQGFNPHPRLVFALSLPLGVVGRNEVVELELDEPLAPEEVRDRLARVAPPGLEVLSAARVPPSAGARVRALCYGLAVPAARVADLRRRAAEVLAAGECWVERARPPRRRLDLRPFLRDLRLTGPPPEPSQEHGRSVEGEGTGSGGSWFLEMDLALTPAGTARPEEVLGLLGLGDLTEAGAVLERTRLELEDEAGPQE